MKKMNVEGIIRDYTNGVKGIEETNKLLKEAGTSFYIDPNKNKLSSKELANTVVSSDPSKVEGWGLLDTGTGSLDKVKIHKGELVDADCGIMTAYVYVLFKTFKVKGKKLVD